MNPRLRVPVLLLVGASLLGACSFSAGDAAKVDGVGISQKDLDNTIPAVKFLAGLQGGVCGADAQGQPPPKGQEDIACSRQTLTLMIQNEVLHQAGEQYDAKVTQDDITRFRDQFIQAAGGEEQFAAALKKAGATQDQLDGLLAKLASYAALSCAYASPNLDETKLKAAYEKNKLQFATIDTAHILVDTKEEADKIMKTLTTENFAEVAKEKSKDPGSGAKGGELGPTPVGNLVPEFSDSVLKAEPGTIIGPVKSEFGYHIIWVHSIDVLPYEAAKCQMVQSDKTAAQAFDAYLKTLYANATVEVNPTYGKWDGTIPEVVALDSTDATAAPVPPAPVPPAAPPAGSYPQQGGAPPAGVPATAP